MNKKELEKLFNEKFSFYWAKDLKENEGIDIPLAFAQGIDEIAHVKDFIFKTVIPEVLKSVIPKKDRDSDIWNELLRAFSKGKNSIINEIKQKAKELYDIDL